MTSEIELLAAVCHKYLPKDEDFGPGTLETQVFARVAAHMEARALESAMAGVSPEKRKELIEFIAAWGEDDKN